jgi:hypothetical protein
MSQAAPLLDYVSWDSLNMEEILENSYKDFHTKGLDYISLQIFDYGRVKAYFFEDGMQDLSEVVNPHDHRYNFTTECITGLIRNKWYSKKPHHLRPGRLYTQYNWDTPLNGGNGFSGGHQVMLWGDGAYTAGPGCQYGMLWNEFHTIQVLKPETCIVLIQYGDKVPVGTPTRTFCADHEPPKINDLYNKFTSDQVMKRINLLKELVNV